MTQLRVLADASCAAVRNLLVNKIALALCTATLSPSLNLL